MCSNAARSGCLAAAEGPWLAGKAAAHRNYASVPLLATTGFQMEDGTTVPSGLNASALVSLPLLDIIDEPISVFVSSAGKLRLQVRGPRRGSGTRVCVGQGVQPASAAP